MRQQRQAGFLMAKIRQVAGRIFERMLKDYAIEISSAQGRIMFALWQKDGVSIYELAKKTQLKKSTLTSMLDRLEKMGYVRRQRSEKDRRKILIHRTSKDENLESEYVRLSQEHAKIFYHGFTEEQIERFEMDLKQILNNLMDYESNAD
ncbi:MAG: MarR family transcriptional regulator [Planctomycetes bacterium RBG_16_55_9]|nr:MAG: MarR family transcriptional regulator [Planctomycetes bacterium RBG_16_55_9]